MQFSTVIAKQECRAFNLQDLQRFTFSRSLKKSYFAERSFGWKWHSNFFPTSIRENMISSAICQKDTPLFFLFFWKCLFWVLDKANVYILILGNEKPKAYLALSCREAKLTLWCFVWQPTLLPHSDLSLFQGPQISLCCWCTVKLK